MSTDVSIAVAVVTSLLALTGTALTLLANRRRTAADTSSLEATASQANASATLALIPALERRIKELEKGMAKATQDLTLANEKIVALVSEGQVRDNELEGLRAGVAVLVAQLREQNMTPRYTPPPRKPGTGPLAAR